MDQVSTEDFEQLVRIIQATYAGKQDEVMKATEILNTMANDPVKFVKVVMMLVTADIPINGKYL